MKMTKNGLNILNPYAITIEMYDENGKLYKVPLEDVSEINTNNVYAGETPVYGDIEYSPIVEAWYEFDGVGNGRYSTFETADGITGESDDDDLKMLEDFIPVGIRDDNVVYMALYADGEKVDLQMHRDAYDEFVKEAEESDVASAHRNRLFLAVGGRSVMARRSISWYQPDMSIEELEREVSHVRENIMFYSAVKEKFEALEAKKIDSVDVVVYDYGRMNGSWRMEDDYLHYYVDENWDKSKFE